MVAANAAAERLADNKARSVIDLVRFAQKVKTTPRAGPCIDMS